MRVAWLLRLVVSGSALTLLLVVLPLGSLISALRSVSPGVVLIAVGGFLAGHAVAALKWRLLMGSRDDLPPGLWLRAHFAGLIANLCLPGVAGGDVVRAGWIIRRTHEKESVAVASLADRGIDLVSLLVLATAGALGIGQLTGTGGRVIAIVATVLVVAGLCGLTLAHARDWAPTGIVRRLLEALRALARQPGRLVGALALSLAVQLGFVMINAWLGEAAGVRPGLAAWLLAWPLAKIIAIVPVSLAGLGVREAALVGFMRPFGVPAPAIMAVGLLWEGILVTGGVLGWLVTLTLPPERVASG